MAIKSTKTEDEKPEPTLQDKIAAKIRKVKSSDIPAPCIDCPNTVAWGTEEKKG